MAKQANPKIEKANHSFSPLMNIQTVTFKLAVWAIQIFVSCRNQTRATQRGQTLSRYTIILLLLNTARSPVISKTKS